jgi:small subunit ribosomal protein S30e
MVKHGGLANAGKVRGQTPKVEKMERDKKRPQGRAAMRAKYNRRYETLGKPRRRGQGPNAQHGQ